MRHSQLPRRAFAFDLILGLLRHTDALARVVKQGVCSSLLIGSLTAWAQPAQIEVCKLVEDNRDATNHGGQFDLGLNTNLGGFGSLQINAFETGPQAGLQCASPVGVPAGATQLSIPEVFPAGWLSSPAAPARPTWSFTGTGLPGAGVVGSSQTATLGGANFAGASGTVRLTFTNRYQRTLTVCKRVEDNGQAPNNQGGAGFLIDLFQTGNSGGSPTIPSTTEGQTNCQTSAVYHLNAEAQFSVREAVPQSMGREATGYPRYELRDENNTLLQTGNLPYGGTSGIHFVYNQMPVSAVGGVGNLTLTIVNRFVTQRNLRLCKSVESSPGFAGTGIFVLMRTVNQQPSTDIAANNMTGTALTVGNGGIACQVVPFNDNFNPLMWEASLPGNWTGNANGYPRWELYVDNGVNDRAGTPLVAGLNEDVGAPASNASGQFVRLDASLVSSDVKLVIVNAMAAYGNGNQANTGDIVRYCKEVEDNGDASIDQARWSIQSLNPSQALGFNTGLNFAEGQRLCGRSLTRAHVQLRQYEAVAETYSPENGGNPTWMGDAPGYPRIQVRTPVGAIHRT